LFPSLGGAPAAPAEGGLSATWAVPGALQPGPAGTGETGALDRPSDGRGDESLLQTPRATCGCGPTAGSAFTVARLSSEASHRAGRDAGPGPGTAAGACEDGDTGLRVTLRARSAGGRLADLSFECSSCVTLVALAEAACRLLEGRPVAEMRCVTVPWVLGHVRDVPPSRADRAVFVAVAARRLALALGCGGMAGAASVPVGGDRPSGGGRP
jgi:hypothetical protein